MIFFYFNLLESFDFNQRTIIFFFFQFRKIMDKKKIMDKNMQNYGQYYAKLGTKIRRAC